MIFINVEKCLRYTYDLLNPSRNVRTYENHINKHVSDTLQKYWIIITKNITSSTFYWCVVKNVEIPTLHVTSGQRATPAASERHQQPASGASGQQVTLVASGRVTVGFLVIAG